MNKLVLRDEQALVGVHFTHPVDCPEHVADWAGSGAVAPDGTQTPPGLACSGAWVFGAGRHHVG